MKILFVGEIVAEVGRKVVAQVLPSIIKETAPDLVIANAENIAGGRGVTVETINELKSYGIDYFTSGDHVFWQKGTDQYIDSLPIVRPANFPAGTPGKSFAIIDTGKKGKVLLVNLMGRTAFNDTARYSDDPFSKIDEILRETADEDIKVTIVDFHGEATSEKGAFGFYVDGRVDAVIGSHTHVPTCDGTVLPGGTLFLTDIGMVGAIDSVLGVEPEIIINVFKTARNQRFEWKNTGRKAFRSVLLDTEKKALQRIDKELS